jgi:hypothetical protein
LVLDAPTADENLSPPLKGGPAAKQSGG